MFQRLSRALLLRLRHQRRILKGHLFRNHLRLLELAGSVRVEGRCRLESPLVADGFGVVTLADDVSFGYWMAPRSGAGEVRLQARFAPSMIRVGEGSSFSNNVTVIAVQGVHIGRRARIGDHVLILDSDFHHLEASRRDAPNPPSAPVHIDEDVWIGSRVIVLKGVRIGSRAVIAAGAVVTSDIPADSIAAGVPARVRRSIAPCFDATSS